MRRLISRQASSCRPLRRQLEHHAMRRLDAGRRMVLVLLDGLEQVFRGLRTQRLVQQVEVQGQGVAGLGVALDAAVGVRHTPG